MQYFLDQPRRDRALLGLLALYLFIYVFAVPMLVFDLVPGWGTGMGGFLLGLQGSIMALWLVRSAGTGGLAAAIMIGGLSFVVEYIGVTTGQPFGAYRYTSILGPKLAGAVPWPIPFAWLLVVPAALGLAAQRVRSWWVAVAAALLALGLDLLIEPVAAYVVHYWEWQAPGPYYGVPTANFLAWGATALVLVALTLALTRRQPVWTWHYQWLPALLYSLNLLQFWLVNLRYGYGAACIVGLGLLAAVWYLRPPAVKAALGRK